ncbi:MAG: benzoate transport [Limisphaerales bacterium]|jgi:benzoate transport
MSTTPQEVIDRGPMYGRQIMAVTICVFLNALDGFDVLSISFASPGIAAEWQIDRAALGIVLSMELIGMAIGSLLLGPAADKYGRRPLILACLVVMTLGMYTVAIADSVIELSIYRFVTGIGIGGMLAAINAMTAEYANEKYRHLCVIIMAGGYPLGAIVGGAIVSELMISYDWRVVFYVGAVMTVLFIPLVYFLLPESVAYLTQRNSMNALDEANQLLKRLGHAAASILPTQLPKSSIAELFTPRLRRTTILLTVAYFAHIMTFYFILKWVPKLVVDMGFHPSEAGGVLVWANVGGLLGCVALGLLSRKYSVRVLVMSVLVGATIMVAYFGRGQDNLTELAVVAGVAGFFTNGAIVGLYAIFAHVFPTNVRAGGTGFVIGLGRGGAALSPIVAGIMFSLSYGLGEVALLMALGSVVAIVALGFLKEPRQS